MIVHYLGAKTQGFQGIVDQIDIYISRFLDVDNALSMSQMLRNLILMTLLFC